MRAIYDLSRYPTTFDFAPWACMAKTKGADSVHFIVDKGIAAWKYPADLAWRRWANIVLPICKLARLPFSVGGSMEGQEFNYLAGELNRLYMATGHIEKLQPTYKFGESGHITITLRDSFRNKYRNSNFEAWSRFKDYLKAKGKKVVVLPECEGQPIDLEYRMSLYASAEMNFGVANGPMALCIFSEAPYITFNWYDAGGEKVQYDQRRLMEKQGFPEGSQFAWRNARQKLVYAKDDFENLVSAYEETLMKEAA